MTLLSIEASNRQRDGQFTPVMARNVTFRPFDMGVGRSLLSAAVAVDFGWDLECPIDPDKSAVALKVMQSLNLVFHIAAQPQGGRR
jgi:hypothetical protein